MAQSKLIAFYRGTGTDSRGRTLAELWRFSDAEMEAIHDFIQWMFPLREPSQFNPDAPLLTDADVAAFRAEGELQANLRRSLDRFLKFLGLERVEGKIARAPNFAARRSIWLYPNHNWQCITRVLHCLRLLGLKAECRALFAGLTDLAQGDNAGITPETFRYWRDAAEGA